MNEAAEEAVLENMENQNPRDISAAFDGTWQKRGYQSKNGVVTCTSVDTGKVIDVSVLSKYCVCKNKDNHDKSCTKNYDGSSGGMEVVGVKEIFQRSVEKYNVRYINYLGDGDSKSYISVVAEKPYGDTVVNKLECVGHIQKRMGARLRRLKNQMKGVKLSDGLPLSGRNRLTDTCIDQLQTYYGLAIRRNTHDYKCMQKAVWATFFHRKSTDENPMHEMCPDGEDSWCRYKKAIATNQHFSHKNSLPEAVMDTIKPIYRELSQPDLLKKCLHGGTQNVNESVNNVIWNRIPKNTFVSYNTLKLGVLDAVACFNKGNIIKCEVLDEIGVQCGRRMIEAMKKIDNDRIRDAKNSISEYERASRRQKRKQTDEEFGEEPAYDPGMY
jgi:hypothetical protein